MIVFDEVESISRLNHKIICQLSNVFIKQEARRAIDHKKKIYKTIAALTLL